uniref:PAW domain-containing protein n=1 Tax=Megaselia scalaris TaxID=36166 RepID=T1GJV5_MEGSC
MSFQALDEEIDKKQFNLRYHCSSDKYERYIKESNGSINIISTYDTWEACQFSSVNIFRKVEKDWKMAYLARNENSNFAEITWKFDFGSSNLVIKEYSIRFDKQTYENGNVQLEIVPDNKSLNVKGSSAFTIKANLSGGKGDCAWQHSQLFRQPLSSKDFPKGNFFFTF